MSEVFVDTAAWIALISKGDRHHAGAMSALRQLSSDNVRLITTEFVFLEVADGFANTALRQDHVILLETLIDNQNVTVVPLERELYLKGWVLYKARTDKKWSLTDCISMVVMEETGLRVAFTSDHHFEQAGFEILLEP